MRADLWTNERIGLLRTLWAAGESAQAIAERLGGVSRSAVLGKLFRLRLSASQPPPVTATRETRTIHDAQRNKPASSRQRRKEDDSRSTRKPARPRGKTLLQLTNETCRWPHGRPGAAGFFFCGAQGADLENGLPYCAAHLRRAYVKHPSISESKPAVDGDVKQTAERPRRFMWRAPVRHPAPRWR